MSRSHAHAGVFGDDAGPQHRASSVPPASNGGSPAATPHTSPARSLSSSAPPSPTDEFESTHYPIRRNTPTPSYSPPRDPSQATLVALPQATYPLPPTYSVPHQSFDGYDLIVPLSAVAAISLLFLGPLLAPKVYLVFLFAYFASFLCLSITHSYKWSLSAARVKRTIREAERGGEEEKLMRDPTGSYVHVFIIPNYEEPLEMLRSTVARLASHRGARTNYVVVLAMEGTEKGHEAKANVLYHDFRGRFKDLVVSVHPAGIPGEARGKGSNVNWAVRFTNAHLRSTSDVSLKQLVVTVTDADSFIPELYVTELEKGMRDVDDPYMTIFSPPMIFARNAHEVPASVRVTDYIWSVMVAQNLSNARGMNFPCSTYSLSMVLADKVGYWDTGFNAIGEDMHMLLKCYFATSGMARGHPIWVPINLTNVQTSGGYLSNMWARYVQAKRHYYGSADVAYALRQTFRGQGGLLRMLVSASKAEWRVFLARLLCCFYVLEAHLVPLTSGWLMFLGVPILQLAGGASLFSSSQALTALYWTVNGLSVSLIIPMIVNVLLYESYVRFVDRELFMKRADDKSIRRWWNIRDYAFLPVGAVLFMTLPATVSSLTALLTMGKEQKYVVSEKVVALDDSDLEDVKLV